MKWPRQPCPICKKLVAIYFQEGTPPGHGWVRQHSVKHAQGKWICGGSFTYVLIQEKRAS